MRAMNLNAVAFRRRLAFFGLRFSSAILASMLMLDILNANGRTFPERLALVFFFVLFTWIAGAFWTAIAGFIIRLTGRPRAFMHPGDVEGQPVKSRTALVMCVYNEDPQHFAAGVDAIWTSLRKEAEQAH